MAHLLNFIVRTGCACGRGRKAPEVLNNSIMAAWPPRRYGNATITGLF